MKSEEKSVFTALEIVLYNFNNEKTTSAWVASSHRFTVMQKHGKVTMATVL
jgi:hypothetical protein